MPVFKYTAEDSNGTQMSGSVTATSEAIAREMLASMQLKPIFIQNSESFITEQEVQDAKTMVH